jgi:hypothetical protein
MTVFANDPIRVKITLDDIWNLTHSPGIDSCFHPSDTENEYYCKLVASDTNPFSPQQEKYQNDLERELEKLKIVQDHIREFKPYSFFNNPCGKKGRTIETILDEKVFSKENRYDILLDKAKDVHRLKNGQLFGIIEEG